MTTQVGRSEAEGRQGIDGARVLVVGLGGLGMVLVQQLAHLGVRHLAVADPDLVNRNSLDRLVDATVDDLGLYKVIVAERLIRATQPGAEVTALMVDLPHDEISAEIATATVVVGCLDRQPPRLVATRSCSAAGVPYIDVAADVPPGPGGRGYGGRVVVAADGTGCVSCLDVLARNGPASERDLDAMTDGVGTAPLTCSRPCAVTIDGVLASIAAMEIMCLLTGLRDPARQLTYRGDLGTVRRSRKHGRADCPYCARWRQGQRHGPTP